MPKLLWRGNWVSGIGSLYNGSHVLPSRRKEGVRVGGKWLYVCKEWYLPQELFSHLTLSLFQLGFWPFHTVLVKVNSNLHLTKSIGRLSVFLFGLSAALKVGTSSFSVKHLLSFWHKFFQFSPSLTGRPFPVCLPVLPPLLDSMCWASQGFLWPFLSSLVERVWREMSSSSSLWG